jgi:hypothetical protein
MLTRLSSLLNGKVWHMRTIPTSFDATNDLPHVLNTQLEADATRHKPPAFENLDQSNNYRTMPEHSTSFLPSLSSHLFVLTITYSRPFPIPR